MTPLKDVVALAVHARWAERLASHPPAGFTWGRLCVNGRMGGLETTLSLYKDTGIGVRDDVKRNVTLDSTLLHSFCQFTEDASGSGYAARPQPMLKSSDNELNTISVDLMIPVVYGNSASERNNSKTLKLTFLARHCSCSRKKRRSSNKRVEVEVRDLKLKYEIRSLTHLKQNHDGIRHLSRQLRIHDNVVSSEGHHHTIFNINLPNKTTNKNVKVCCYLRILSDSLWTIPQRDYPVGNWADVCVTITSKHV
ncbi:hypothetical protein J6590_084507 [Homalodisca vitripennis]|nr:hypothetical protein J6590_084507 [Homalodisca vitripennis]